MRWQVALKYLKNPHTYDCNYCSETKNLRENRNCDWDKPGECKTCGEIPFKDVEKERESSKFICPICGGRVKFPTNAEFSLGKGHRTPGCPKSKVTPRAIFLLQLVDWSDEVGVLPTATTLFDESLLYFEIRNFILSERMKSEEEMRPKEK